MNKLAASIAFVCLGAFGQTPNVRAWGAGGAGELGNGVDELTVSANVPVQVSGLTNVMEIACGYYHTLALKKDGTVWAWGFNAYGELGNGTNTDSSVPVQVSGLNGVTAIAGGEYHSLALKSDGTVWAWGDNSYAALGIEPYLPSSNVPMPVSGLTGVMALAAGFEHSLALKQDGTVWAWGRGIYGQLGIGFNAAALISEVPVQVNGLTGVVAVAAGQYHSLAVKSDGTAWAWGNDEQGQLGDGFRGDYYSPMPISGLTSVSAIAGGDQYSIALKSDGTVWAWGSVAFASSNPFMFYVPVQVDGLTGATAIAAGSYHTVALKSDGTVWAVGYNLEGQLGNGTFVSGNAAVPVSGLTGVVSIAARGDYSLALKNDGTVWAWGDNGVGELGNGASAVSDQPVPVSGVSGVVAVAEGQSDSLALKSDGTVWAWGDHVESQSGLGPDTNVPVPMSGLTNVIEIAAGDVHSLALKADGTVWAWGDNQYGELGNGTLKNSNAPVQVNGLTGVLAIAAGASHSLALKADGTVWAWGYNYNCQLGDGNVSNHSDTPVEVIGLFGAGAIAGGATHSVALKSDGTVWAWGGNYNGELGNGDIGSNYNDGGSCLPVPVVGLTGVAAIASRGSDSLALKNDGSVWAWGAYYYGQLGNGSNTYGYVPVKVGNLEDVMSISAGQNYSLALKGDGTAWAWGYNGDGELGDGTNGNSDVPTQVNGLSGVAAISAGDYHSLAVLAGGIPQLAGFSFNGSGSISNAGTAPLSISNVAITGINPGDFSLGGTCAGALLVVNQNCTITVAFTPSASGIRSADVLVTANAPGSPFLIPVSLTGTPSAACSFALSSVTLQSPVSGGDLSISIQTAANCAWAIIGLPDWITTATSSGTGPATLTLSVAANTGEPRSALVLVASIMAAVNQASSQLAITDAGVVNAASFTAPVAPGSLASLFGNFLLASPLSVSSFPIPTSLGGLSIDFYSGSAPLFYASAGQVNAQIPWELEVEEQNEVAASTSTQQSNPKPLNLATYAPGLFAINGAGTGQGAILDSNYNLVSSTNPSTAGSVVQIFCTGLGPVTNQPATGAASPSNPLASTPTLPIVMIGGAQATVQFSGLTPGDVGLYQVNATIPAGAAKGTAVPVMLSIGGVQSNAVTIAVQ